MIVTPTKLMPYYAYRTCHTGITEYHYFVGKEEIGNATVPTMPQKSVYIEAPLLYLLCDVDTEITLVPGTCRNICYADRETRTERHAQIVYLKPGHHCIYIHDNIYDVYYKLGKYYIYENHIPLARITLNSLFNPGSDLRLTMQVKTEISDSLASLLLSFPLLQIGT